MRLNISPRDLRNRLPITIGDDLRVSIRHGGETHLTPKDAIAIGCRLIRQASVVDPALVTYADTPKRAKHHARKAR